MHLDYAALIDTYYAYDFNHPEVNRFFTTQPVKHGQLAVNLAYAEVKFQTDRLRSRIALQTGDSVERNAVNEKGFGRYIQESYLGAKLGEKTWLDAGVFFGNIGAESWISKDNWTYTRALNLDYVPYYSAGVRLVHEFNSKQSAHLQILNGWQNISENNNSKAVGMQYKHLLSEEFTFTYNNFFGDEEVVSDKPRFRAYHNFIFKWHYSEFWQYLIAFDIGHQAQQENDGVDPWFSPTATVRRVLNPNQSLAARLEYYNDRHQVNVPTGTPNGFQVIGASVNFDQKLAEKALWRTELRGFKSKDEIFPQGTTDKTQTDFCFVTSISAWF